MSRAARLATEQEPWVAELPGLGTCHVWSDGRALLLPDAGAPADARALLWQAWGEPLSFVRRGFDLLVGSAWATPLGPPAQSPPDGRVPAIPAIPVNPAIPAIPVIPAPQPRPGERAAVLVSGAPGAEARLGAGLARLAWTPLAQALVPARIQPDPARVHLSPRFPADPAIHPDQRMGADPAIHPDQRMGADAEGSRAPADDQDTALTQPDDQAGSGQPADRQDAGQVPLGGIVVLLAGVPGDAADLREVRGRERLRHAAPLPCYAGNDDIDRRSAAMTALASLPMLVGSGRGVSRDPDRAAAQVAAWLDALPTGRRG